VNRLRNILSDKFNVDVLWNAGSLVILAVGGIIVNLVVVNLRGNAALGIFNQVFAFYILFSQLAVGGLQHSVLKSVSHNQEDRPLCADITSSAMILIGIIMIPLSFLIAFLAEPIGQLVDSPAVAEGIYLIIPGLLFFAFNKVLINTLNGLSHMRAYAIFRSLRFISLPISIVVIVLLDLPDAQIALSLTISELLLFIALIIYTYTRVIPLKWIDNLGSWIREHFSFGLRGILSGVLSELNTRVDIFMLGIFLDDTIVGVYSFAAILTEGFSQLALVLRWNVDPLLGKFIATGKRREIAQLAIDTRRKFLPIMIGIGVLGILGYPIGYMIFVRDDFLWVSAAIFTIIMIGVCFNFVYRPFEGILLLDGKPAMHTLMILSLVSFNVIFNALLIPLVGVYGAALATSMTYIVQAILIWSVSRWLVGVRL